MTGWLEAIAQVSGLARKSPRTPDKFWDDEIPIPPDHPLVPAPIRRDVSGYWEAGCRLHRVQTQDGIEWWLFDANGALIEAFWLK